MAISQQPVDGFSPDFESRWIAMSSIYINIYKNLAHLLEVQESKKCCVTLKISFVAALRVKFLIEM